MSQALGFAGSEWSFETSMDKRVKERKSEIKREREIASEKEKNEENK